VMAAIPRIGPSTETNTSPSSRNEGDCLSASVSFAASQRARFQMQDATEKEIPRF
jgi:hypothetical protein